MAPVAEMAICTALARPAPGYDRIMRGDRAFEPQATVVGRDLRGAICEGRTAP